MSLNKLKTLNFQIRNSGDSITVVVQPVAELVELSRRCMVAATPDETDKSLVNVSDCNTLRRSASKRFKAEVSDFQTIFLFKFIFSRSMNHIFFLLKKTI